MPSSITDRHDWPLEGAPISNDFRAQHYSPKTGRSRRQGTGCYQCKIGEEYATRRLDRYHRKSDAPVLANTIEESRDLAATTLVEQYKGSGRCQLDDDADCDLRCEDATVRELWRLGLLYSNAQERGPGVTLDVITHDQQEISISYKPIKRPRRRPSQTVAAAPLSPALSFVHISSDVELAAFLSVHDFVDVGAESSEDEDFALL